jgi:sugar diacid utilization regulator
MPASDRRSVNPGELAALAAQTAADVGGLDPKLLADHLELVVEIAGSGRRLTRAELDRYRRSGQHAAEQGVALRAVVELYLSGTWRIWPRLPAVADADAGTVATAGEAVLRAADDGVAALAEGYQLARQTLVRRQDAERREFFDDLLSGRADVAGLVARAAGFGIDLATPHAVAVVRAEHEFADATPIIGQLERAILGRRRDASALIASKEHLLVVVFAAPDAADIRNVADQVVITLRSGSAARSRRGIGSWQMGMGRMHSGPAGVRASYEEGRNALDLAARLELDAPVVFATDLLVYDVILRDRHAITDLVSEVLGPLAGSSSGDRALLDTLAAYLDSGGNTVATARTLQLSVRAVSYRLARIAALLGRDPTDPQERLPLHVAAVGARLLHWPTGGPPASDTLP